jgi:hypothetical protein
MRSSIALALLLLVGVRALAADADAPKYAPGIIGRLTDAGRPLMANVCLRTAGSEIRQCAYSDFDGRFYIPTLGAAHMKYTGEDDDRAGVYPEQWLELGTRGDAAKKLYPIGLVDGKKSILRLDCDIAKRIDAAADAASHYCQIAPEQSPAQAHR